MLLLSDNFQLLLFCNNNLVFYLGSMLWAKESPPAASESSFPREKIHSVSLAQLFGEIGVVGSHLALSAQSKQGQSAMDSMEGGSLIGKSL
jgi:hypothetical protein